MITALASAVSFVSGVALTLVVLRRHTASAIRELGEAIAEAAVVIAERLESPQKGE